MNSLTTAQRAPYRIALQARQTAILKGGWRGKSHTDIGGPSMVTLSRLLRDFANGRCVCCRQVTTVDTIARLLTTATVGTLIPSVMFGPMEARYGIMGGNCGSFCRACINASNASVSATGEVFVWTPDTIDAEFIPLTLPKLPKSVTVLTPEEIACEAERVRVWAARGIV